MVHPAAAVRGGRISTRPVGQDHSGRMSVGYAIGVCRGLFERERRATGRGPSLRPDSPVGPLLAVPDNRIRRSCFDETRLCEEYQHLDRGPVIKSIQAAVTQFSITRANLGSAELDHIARKRVADAALRRRRRKSPQVAESMSITAGGLR